MSDPSSVPGEHEGPRSDQGESSLEGQEDLGLLVFLSYGSEDQAVARELRRILGEEGFRVWMAPDDVRGSRPWAEQILEAISSASIVIVLVSADSTNSQHVGREVNLALEQGKPLLPVRVEDVALSGTLQYLLTLWQWVDAFPPPLDRHRGLVLERIRDVLADIGYPEGVPLQRAAEPGHHDATAEARPTPSKPLSWVRGRFGSGAPSISDPSSSGAWWRRFVPEMIAQRRRMLGVSALVVILGVVLALILTSGPPPVPTGLIAAPSPEGVELTWDPADEGTGITEFLIYRDDEEIVVIPGTGTSYMDTAADLSRSYSYSIQATDAGGRASELSEPVTSAPLTPPGVPTGLLADVGPESIELNWVGPADDSSLRGFGVYRNGELIATVTEASYVDARLDTANPYEYEVDAMATEEIRSARSEVAQTLPYVEELAPFDLVEREIFVAGQFHLYEIRGEANQFITIFLNSEDGSPLVEVFTPTGALLVADEDLEIVVLDLRLPEAGEYELRVGFVDGSLGSYNLSYSVLTELSLPGSGSGEMDEQAFNEWAFAGDAGEEIVITLYPDSAAPRLELFSPGGTRISEFEGQDPGLPIVIFETLPEDGDYVIRAEYVSGSGGYRIALNRFVELLPRVSVTGALDGTLDADLADFYTFEGQAGINFTAVVESETGSPFIALFDPGGQLIASDDTSLTVSLPDTGTHELAVGFTEGSGTYSLFYDRDLPVATAGSTIGAATSAPGDLDTYTFEAAAGETIIIFMTSEAGTAEWTLLDSSFNVLGSASAGVITYVVTDDDFYLVEASTTTGAGPYQLVVTRFVP